MLNSPSQPMAVAEASPMWLLCAQTIAFAPGPRLSSKASKVSNMWRSRKFQDLRAPRYTARYYRSAARTTLAFCAASKKASPSWRM